MKFHETHFEDYANAVKRVSLHPALTKLYKTFPKAIGSLQNLIFYGPKGVGKYSQVLSYIQRYSNSDLKYEKRLMVTYEKDSFFLKISDVHFEVDMSLLGCNSKSIWNEIYNQIIEVVSSRPDPHAFIVCKYFNRIHIELLDTFYSYMQSMAGSINANLKFILITEQLSFIPDNILQHCEIVHVKRPMMTAYNRVLAAAAKEPNATTTIACLPRTDGGQLAVPLHRISNLKAIKSDLCQLMNPHEIICNKILDVLRHPDDLKFLAFRDTLYEILIYDLDITECIWYILDNLVNDGSLPEDSMDDIMIRTYAFLQYYNNNYRPIYHLENYMFILIMHLHGYNAIA